jgi:hypothetical protein
MAPTTTSFESEQAPCGRVVEGEGYEFADEQGMSINDRHYACGCRSVMHEYHDGSIARKVVHHDGRVLVDELLAER